MVARVLRVVDPSRNPRMLSGVTGGVQENRPSEAQNVVMTVLRGLPDTPRWDPYCG